MSKLLSAALDYASRGWPIFPLAPNSKEPIAGTSGVLDATTDLATIRKWWAATPDANIGLDVGGAGMMVLDLDPGHDAAQLDAALGKRPHTGLRQRTPRNGTHEFYALARGEHVSPSAGKIAPNVDVRSFHSYVVLAPSKLPNGAYEWENDDWPAPKAAYRSEKMVEVANLARQKDRDRDTWIIDPDMPEHVERYVKWLKGEVQINGSYCKIAIEGQGGDHCAYATAAMGKSFGIAPETALDLMIEHWNPRCEPPWSEAELDHLQGKVEHAYRYNTSPPGNMTDAYRKAKTEAMFQPVSRDASAGAFWSVGRFRIVDRAAMEDIKDPSWLTKSDGEGMLPERAYTMLVGAPGSLKTFVALDIGLSIASGRDTLWNAISQGACVFAAGEGRSGLRNRVRAWENKYLDGKRVEPGRFWLLDPVPAIARDGEIETFIKLVQHALDGEKCKLVVLDTLGRAMQGVSENDQEHASKFTAAVETICKELDCTVLAIHHSGHGEKRARGSSVFQGDLDTILLAEREGKDMALTLSMQKQKDAPEWEHARSIKLEEVSLANGQKSLVVAAPNASDPKPQATAPKPSQPAGNGKRGRPMGVAPEVVDDAAMAIIGKVKGGSWSSNQFADLIAAHLGSGVPASTIRTNYMRNFLQCDARFKSHKHYDALTKRWKSS
jgi:hypothetical protein